MVPGEQLSDRQYDRAGRYFLLGALGLTLYFAWKIFRPFLAAIAIAAVIDIVFFPLFARLRRAFGGRRVPAAAVTVLVVVLCVLLPLIGMGFLFTKQALDLYQALSAKARDGSLDQILSFRNWDVIEGWLHVHAPWLNTQAINLKGIFLNLLQKVSAYGVALGTAAASNTLAAIGTFAVVLFSLFFLLLDGATFARWAWGMAPLTEEHRILISYTFNSIIKSTVYGSGLIAVVQGLFGGLAFWVVGLPGVLWGLAMVFMSVVPVVGTAIIWVPAGLILLAQGHVGGGIFLLAWGALVISNADTVIRIFVVKGPVPMHPLLIFFSVIGGIKFAGLLGVVYGPLVLALSRTLLEIYRVEFLGQPVPAPQEEAP